MPISPIVVVMEFWGRSNEPPLLHVDARTGCLGARVGAGGKWPIGPVEDQLLSQWVQMREQAKTAQAGGDREP